MVKHQWLEDDGEMGCCRRCGRDYDEKPTDTCPVGWDQIKEHAHKIISGDDDNKCSVSLGVFWYLNQALDGDPPYVTCIDDAIDRLTRLRGLFTEQISADKLEQHADLLARMVAKHEADAFTESEPRELYVVLLADYRREMVKEHFDKALSACFKIGTWATGTKPGPPR